MYIQWKLDEIPEKYQIAIVMLNVLFGMIVAPQPFFISLTMAIIMMSIMLLWSIYWQSTISFRRNK